MTGMLEIRVRIRRDIIYGSLIKTLQGNIKDAAYMHQNETSDHQT